MNQILDTSRRDIFKLAGGGIVIFFGMNPLVRAAAQNWPPYPSDFHAYLAVGENGRVTVFSGKIEMGQGVLTSQAQMAAEELGVGLSSIDMVLGDTDRCPWDMGTFGSLTTRMFGPHLRAAAAKARLVLVGLAAKRLGVDAAKLEVTDGVVSVIGDPARKVSYGELSREARMADSVNENPALHTPAQFRIMGQSPKRLDGIEKVTGAAKYAGDIRRPGMLYARLLRPPQHGASLAKADTSAAEKLPGVTVVRHDDLIAVLHADPETAAAALDKVFADWKRPPATLDQNTIFDHITATAKTVSVLQTKGDATKPAARTINATYRKGYVAHSPVEPHTALAEVKDGKATVWASTQTPFPIRDAIAKALSFDKKAVRVITPYLGGGFGGKSAGSRRSKPQGCPRSRAVPCRWRGRGRRNSISTLSIPPQSRRCGRASTPRVASPSGTTRSMPPAGAAQISSTTPTTSVYGPSAGCPSKAMPRKRGCIPSRSAPGGRPART